MKKLLLILAAVLLSCGQPSEPTALSGQTAPVMEPTETPQAEGVREPDTPVVISEPAAIPITPEPAPEPVPTPEPAPPEPPKPIAAPYGSTVIGETAYYVSNGAAMSLNLRNGETRTISAAAREYRRENDYDYIDNTDTGKMAAWTNNAVFIESSGALWIIERGYNAVKAQVITPAGIRDFGWQKQIDFLPLSENTPGRKLEIRCEAGGRFFRVRVFQVTDPADWIPFKPSPVPDYVLRCQELTLNPYAERPVIVGDWVDVRTVEKYEGDFIFEYLADGRILAAGKLYRLTAEGLKE